MTDPNRSYNGIAGLPYSVVRITAGVANDSANISYGTGFAYTFEFPNDISVPVVVSNKHVLLNRPWLSFALGRRGPDGMRALGRSIDVRITTEGVPILGHPDPQMDLAVIPLNPIIQMAEAGGDLPSIVALTADNLLPSAEESDLHAATQVLMVGFPNGLMDMTNNLPVVRRGSLATPFPADYQGRPDFAVDIAAFGGSSGSPVFAFFDGMRQRGGETLMGGQSVHLIGVLHSGPTMDANGVLIQRPVPTETIPMIRHMINIGVCAKARLLDDFGPAIAALAGSSDLPRRRP